MDDDGGGATGRPPRDRRPFPESVARQRTARLAGGAGVVPRPTATSTAAIAAPGELSHRGAGDRASSGGPLRVYRYLDRPRHHAAPAGRAQPAYRPSLQRAGLSGAVDGAMPPDGP